VAHWQLVIFDNDGVVVDSEPLAALATSEVLASLGLPITPEECDRLFRGGALARTRQLAERRSGRPLAPQFEDMYTARLLDLMRDHLRPVPGVEAVLGRLQLAGVPYCLASSGRRERVRFALETTGLASYFAERWWGAEDVAHGKPAPDLFLKAATSMGVGPDHCVVVEDSAVGVQAARSAGMAVLGYAAATPAADLAGADVVFSDMAELPALLLGP
jgi:HAD superfamily hydrolase (TIGR01509 family)